MERGDQIGEKKFGVGIVEKKKKIYREKRFEGRSLFREREKKGKERKKERKKMEEIRIKGGEGGKDAGR